MLNLAAASASRDPRQFSAKNLHAAFWQNAIQSIHMGGDRTGVGNESVKGNKRANGRKKGEHAIERHPGRKGQNPIFRKAVPNPFENV